MIKGRSSPDAHFVLGGYHFIFVSNDVYAPGSAFSDEKLAWLRSELDAAASEDSSGAKPIFVFQHEPPGGSGLPAESFRKAGDDRARCPRKRLPADLPAVSESDRGAFLLAEPFEFGVL